MTRDSEDLIAELVSELRPVTPLRLRAGFLRAGTAAALALILVMITVGLRGDLLAGRPEPLFLVSAGIFLILAAATSWAAIEMGQPSIGSRWEGWAWAALMAMSLPAAALLTLGFGWAYGRTPAVGLDGLRCLGMSAGLGVALAVTLTLWLQRGAPSSPDRAGLIIGLASGATGMFAVSLFCPHDDIAHIGFWHGGAVALCGILGRLIIPRFLRW